MLLERLAQHNIAIWGMGKEGQAVLTWLQKRFPHKEIQLIDDSKFPVAESVMVQGISMHPYLLDILRKSDIIIRSPGVSIYKPEVVYAREQLSIEFLTSSNIFFALWQEYKQQHKKFPVTIGVTGTKGKTTTVSLINHLLQGLGHRSTCAGNIGIPLIELADDFASYDYIVAELSSYQVSDLAYFPQYCLLLNLYPEHLQWHLTHENYYRDKAHLLQGEVNICLDDPKCRQYIPDSAHCLYFQTPDGYHYQPDEGLEYRGGTPLFNVKELQLLGDGNYTNICAILTLVEQLKLPVDQHLWQLLEEFVPVQHRLQLVRKVNNIWFVNDSISTIPESALVALQAFKDHTIIPLLGGYDREQDYNQLAQYLITAPNIHEVILMGSTAERIRRTLEGLLRHETLGIHRATTLDEALQLVKRLLVQQSIVDGVVLLSPAAPSYDMYKNFEERGQKFNDLVHQLW